MLLQQVHANRVRLRFLKQKTDKADAEHEKAVRTEDAVASARKMKKLPKIPKKKKA